MDDRTRMEIKQEVSAQLGSQIDVKVKALRNTIVAFLAGLTCFGLFGGFLGWAFLGKVIIKKVYPPGEIFTDVAEEFERSDNTKKAKDAITGAYPTADVARDVLNHWKGMGDEVSEIGELVRRADMGDAENKALKLENFPTIQQNIETGVWDYLSAGKPTDYRRLVTANFYDAIRDGHKDFVERMVSLVDSNRDALVKEISDIKGWYPVNIQIIEEKRGGEGTPNGATLNHASLQVGFVWDTKNAPDAY